MGLFDYVNEFTTGSSADKLTIMPRGAGAPGLDDTFGLKEEDITAIERTSGVYEVSGMYAKPAEIQQGKIKKFVFIIGYEPDKPIVFEVSNIGLEKGRWLTQGDSGKVILGYNYMFDDVIFPRGLDLNDKIEIQGEDFRIVGFVESVGNPQDDSQIYVTNEIMEDLYGKENLPGYSMVMARVDVTDISQITENVKKSLRKSRNVEEGKEDFTVQSWEDMLETYTSVLNGIIGFILLIAFVSVVVSAINTANTMITSVLERYKEIGIIKSIGAKNSEVFKIFLFESGFLGFVAGVVGVLFGWAIVSAVGALLNSIGWGFLTPSTPISLFVGLVVFATLTGAISGSIPAYKASRINPVEALRYE